MALGGLDGGDQVLVAADEDGVADGAVAGEGFEVTADQGVDALLLVVGVEVAEADLDVGEGGDGELLGGVDAAAGAVVPVDAEQAAVGEDLAGPVDEGVDEPLGVEVEGAAFLGAGDQASGGGVEVAGVDEDGVGGGGLRHLRQHAFQEFVGAVDAGVERGQVIVVVQHRSIVGGGGGSRSTMDTRQ